MAEDPKFRSRALRSLPAALADFYAPGLTAATYVDRAFALTSRLLRFSLNSHGVIDRQTGVLTATFDIRRRDSPTPSPRSASTWPSTRCFA